MKRSFLLAFFTLLTPVAFIALQACRKPSAPAAAAPTQLSLAIVRNGTPLRTLSRADLESFAPVEQFTAFDPYYQKSKTFRAIALAPVLSRAFGETPEELAKHDYLLRARDGYTVPFRGPQLLEPGAYLAVADVEVPGWEPIGPQKANPAPLYLVWREPAQQNLDTHPRPWQLATLEMAPFESTFPHAVPTGAPDGSPAARGFQIFRAQCLACHAINREGGRVGPDLNVPLSVVEYRPEDQIRAYIRDPRTFRYSNMPAHPGLRDVDLDDLLAYFRVMRNHKHDADATAKGDGGAP